MPCAMAAACWKRTCAETAKLLLHRQVSWGCFQVSPGAWSHSVPPHLGWVEGCPSAWGAGLLLGAVEPCRKSCRGWDAGWKDVFEPVLFHHMAWSSRERSQVSVRVTCAHRWLGHGRCTATAAVRAELLT